MADEQGSIEIGVRIDSSDAVKGLEKIQASLNGTGSAAGTMAKDVTSAAQQSSKQTTQAANTTVKNEEKVQTALRNTGKTAESTAKDRKKALDTTDEIVGLESLQDSTGELDSSLKGLAGAVGVVSPELEIMLMRTGDLSGGLEAGARLTSLFGGSLGSLLRVLGPVTLAVTGVFVVYNKLSGGLKEAEEKLEQTHQEMEKGIAAARAYEARMRGVRVAVGLLSGDQQILRDASDAAAQGLEHQAARAEKARERASVLRIAIRENTAAISAAQGANASATVSYVELEEALEAAGRAANGETVAMDRNSDSAGSLRRNQAELRETIRHLTGALAVAESQIDSYDSAVQRDTALHLIANAITSDSVDLMIKASDQLENLTGATRETVEARLLQAISSKRAAEAEEAQAAAVERARKAAQDAEEAERRRLEARESLIRMTAEASGDAAVIDFEYAQALKEISRVVKEAGAGEAEAAILIKAATDQRREALEQLEEAEESYLKTKSTFVPVTVKLEQDAATAAKAILDNRQADLFMALKDETITQEQFHQQSLIAEEEYQTQLANLRRAKQQETIATAQMVSDTLMGLVDSNISLVSNRLDKEEADALARAEGNMEEQEKIREEFEKKRKDEMSRLFRIQQGVEIANVAINAASASVAALAPPPTGLGPVLGPALIPFIAGAALAQVGAIASQSPSFHQGGIVGGMGDQPITAQGGEVILNRSAVAALGGADAADSLNSGGRPGGAVIVQMTYKQKVFDQVVVDNLAKGGPLKNALNRSERRGRRGRIGGRL